MLRAVALHLLQRGTSQLQYLGRQRAQSLARGFYFAGDERARNVTLELVVGALEQRAARVA